MSNHARIADTEEVARYAADLLRGGYHCSEAIMLAVGKRYLPALDETSVRMTTPFGGGIAGTRAELCGALSAGVMVIGGLHGRLMHGVDDSLAYSLAEALRERFIQRWQTTICGPVHDLAVHPDGTSGCDEVVAETARILLDILGEPAL